MIKYEPCGNCIIKNGLGYLEEKTNKNIPSLKRCDCTKKYLREKNKEIKLRYANLSYNDFTMENYWDNSEDMIKINKFINFFINKYNNINLWLQGDIKSQTPFLLRYILARIIINYEVKGYYVAFSDLSNILIKAERDESIQNYVNKLINCDILGLYHVLDKTKNVIFKSGFQIPYIYDFLDKRFSSKKSTIMASELEFSKIEQYGVSQEIEQLILFNIHDNLIIKDSSYKKIDVKDLWR